MARPRSPVSRFSDVFTLRLPDGMRDQLAEKAAENGRSANTEIVMRLEQSLAASSPEVGDLRELIRTEMEATRKLLKAELARAVEEILAKK